MKKQLQFILTLLLLLGFQVAAYGQIVFTKADLDSQIGQSFTTTDYFTINLDGGNAAVVQGLLDDQGDNRTWNFGLVSGYEEKSTTMASFLALPLDPPPPGASDPLAQNATYVTKSYEPGMENEAAWGYQSITDTEHLFYGFAGWDESEQQYVTSFYGSPLLSNPVPWRHDSPPWVSEVTQTLTVGGQSFTQLIKHTVTMQGYGTLILPGGTSVQVLRYERQIDVTTPPPFPFTLTSYTVHFISKDVATSAAISLDQARQVTGIAYTTSGGGSGGTAPQDAPILTNPLNAAPDQSTSPTLGWTSVDDATSYDVQVATDAGFTSVVQNQTGVGGTELTVGPLANNTMHYWRARGVNNIGTGPWSTASTFTTAASAPTVAPTLTAPANAATDQLTTPALSWGVVAGATMYTVQVATDNAFSSIAFEASGLLTAQAAAGPLANGTMYYWRARGENGGGVGPWSNVRSFTTIAAAPTIPPASLDPADGAIDLPSSPTLSWNAVAGATSYDVQVATDQNFSTIVADETGVTETQLTIGPLGKSNSALGGGTTHYWRVRGANAGGPGPWAPTQSFTTAVTAPTAAPALTSPDDGATDLPVSSTLTWDAVGDATSYDVQVATDAGFATLVVDQSGVGDTELAVGPLASNTMHYWRARAVNEGGAGPWATGRSFTTVSGVAIEQLDDVLPTTYALHQNYPNPFNPSTSIRFDLPEATHATLTVYDALGRALTTLVSNTLAPGSYAYTWDGGDRPSGIYLYRLQAGSFSSTGTMLLLK